MTMTLSKSERSAIVRSYAEAAAWLEEQRRKDLEEQQPMTLRGTLESVLVKEDGTIALKRVDNGISNAGWDFISHSIGNRAASGATAAMGWIAIGTGTTAFAATQTALVTELTRASASFGHTVGTKVFTFSSTFAAGVGTGSITESGVFNQATLGGTMLDRVVFTAIVKAAGDSLTQTFTFTMS